MTSAEENLLDWLRDAHAMEEQAETMLEKTVARLESYPALRDRLKAHIGETREQARLVKSCIDRRGSGTSVMKDLAGKVAGTAQGLSGLFVADEVVKASMASYTFEHMEIAAYRCLIAAAEVVGDGETRRICQQILEQEEAMAAWLEEELPHVTKKFLESAEKPRTTAKH